MNTNFELEGFVSTVNEGRPVVLLLGQDAWRDRDKNDQVLVSALSRSGRAPASRVTVSYNDLLAAEPLSEEFYEWLADTLLKRPQPQWMERIAQLPLNAVFTSSVDPSLSRALRSSGRDVEVVLSANDNPDNPRSRRNLHLTYLFGRAGERDANEAPPRSALERRRRAAIHANPLIARILDTTTALGVLVIDGLSTSRDWLSADGLLGVISAFGPGQVFWFGWRPEENPGILEAFSELQAPVGPVVFLGERFSQILERLSLANRITLSAEREFVANDVISFDGHMLELDAATRLRTSTAAAVLHDGWLDQNAPLVGEARYVEFRRFHGHVEDAKRFVEGIRRGFAIERDFEKRLLGRVKRDLTTAGRVQEPVLVHGQSGSGKSIALARLALKIREEGKFPVLLASRATRLPGVDEVDDFCLRAEAVGALATLLICDANAPATRYRDLLRGFQSRGRRVVVVGSTYRVFDQSPDVEAVDVRFLQEVPADLSQREANDLLKLMQQETGRALAASPSRYLLPAVYRLLPEVRPRLADGLANEARMTEDDLRSRGKATRAAPPKPSGALGQALVAAGLVDPKAVLDDRIEEFLGCLSDAASRAIDFVMMPGKLDCPVPVNLLMRAIGGSESITDIAQLFSGIDLFRWSNNDEDDVFVHPRLRVEAELIVARRLGTAEAETTVALHLLRSASPTSYGSAERRFVLDLVHRLGPDGPYGKRYAQKYLEIARALTEIRLSRGVHDPSLMLQEATLRRRVLRDSPELPDLDPAKILEEAKDVVDLAISEFGSSNSPGLKRMCANLKVERAAIYGFRAVQRLKSGGDSTEVWQYYQAARDSARNAVFAVDSYFAIDVSVWVPNDLLREGRWSEDIRAELVSDIWDGLDRVDPGLLDPGQQEKYEERRLKVSQTLDDHQLKETALMGLQRMGSKAGILLSARSLGGSLTGRGTVERGDLARAEAAVGFLMEHIADVRVDARCLRYLLRAAWITSTGHYLFGGDHSPLPEDVTSLRALLDTADTLAGLEGALGDPRTQYLRAVLAWRLQREHSAVDIWHLLAQETAFSDPRRTVRHHIWTEGGGRPKHFFGRVSWEDAGKGRARVQVDEIRQEVELLHRDFPQVNIRRGADITGGFYVAFNFIGPIAENPARRGGVR